MPEIVVVSGKGGTGKTSVLAAFAALAGNSVLCDADVDAADLHLLLQPEIMRHSDFIGGRLAAINQERCESCGQCLGLCRFQAISAALEVDPVACEGCGVCVDLCPAKAIDFPEQKCGDWFVSHTRFGPMVHAQLGIAQENSGKLVSLIRREAASFARAGDYPLILTDGPPGIGCPVIASITGADLLVLVVEPSLSGIHDMERLVALASHFRLPVALIINKCDLNQRITASLLDWAATRQIEVVGQIPVDQIFTRAMIAGISVVETGEKSPAVQALQDAWQRLQLVLVPPDGRAEQQGIQLQYL